MPSLISGFEYDIFISYRQKDNKYDGWVTEFASNLKKELEATFKEDISIYFDENPRDGLLETHNVDKSLEGKMKCLIFIPIISQTYCDPKSFAWQREFCAFNALAKRDQFGRDIKLGNGNVASRILPIKIHDLDAEDKSLLENELGGTLRAIDFIYKEAGVNRSLKSTDSKNDNQNKTDYRNQVNKAANAIKEIISSLKKSSSMEPINTTPQESRAQKIGSLSKKKPDLKKTIILYGLSLAGLVTLLNFFEYSFLVRDLSLEIYIGVIAVLFTGLGVWVGRKVTRKRIVVASGNFQLDENLLTRLSISKREYEVLELISSGLSNQEIADKLFVSVNTIKTHSSNLFQKLEVSRRTLAIKRAKELRLIP